MSEVGLADGDSFREDALSELLGGDLTKPMVFAGATIGYQGPKAPDGLWGKRDNSGLTVGYVLRSRKEIDDRLVDFTLSMTEHAVCLINQSDIANPRADTLAVYSAVFRFYAQRAKVRRQLKLPPKRLWFLFPSFAGERCDAATILDRGLPIFVNRLWKEALGPLHKCPFTEIFDYEVLFNFADSVDDESRAQIRQLCDEWNERVEQRTPLNSTKVLPDECTKAEFLRLASQLWNDIFAAGSSSPYMLAYRLKELEEARNALKQSSAHGRLTRRQLSEAAAGTNDNSPKATDMATRSASTRGIIHNRGFA